MTENKKSNRFTLKNYIAISTFNANSDQNITIQINNKVFYKNDLAKNKEHHLKISDYFDYVEPGENTIEINWSGEQECENKFMKIYKIVINDQYIAPHSVRITPFPTEYIKGLQSTEEGKIFYRKKILNPGHMQGWYGIYKFKFLLDIHEIKKTQQLSSIASTGIRLDRVFSDLAKAKLDKKVNKNEN